jgi:phosphatidyl-myo-inositol dimannoside synthase
MANVGGMQRVAIELHDAMAQSMSVDFSAQVLRTSFLRSHFLSVPFFASSLKRIYSLAERGEVDAVLFSSMVTASMSVALRRHLQRFGVTSAAIVHGLDVTMPFKPYQRFVPRVFDALDMVLPVSNATGEACVERGARSDDVIVVPNGIDVSRFERPPGTRRARRALLKTLEDPAQPVRPEDFVICSVGRQVRRKGFAWFVDNVMPLLPENVHYWLVGDGPENEAIRAAVSRRNLDHRVRLLGRIPEEHLSRLYRGADLFAMPNVPVAGDMEGFGVVMLEANLGGLPVVASRLEGIQDVIVEGANGHFVESGNAWEFSEGIVRYVYDADALERASHRALRHVRDNFSWTSVAERYAGVLEARTVPDYAAASALAA